MPKRLHELMKKLENECLSVYDVLEKAFKSLCECDAVRFSNCLQGAFSYMYGTGLISKDTYSLCINRLNLHAPWRYIRENPDHTISCYTSEGLWNTLYADDLIAEILIKIITDKIFVAKYPGIDSEFFKIKMSNTWFPPEWYDIGASFSKAANIVFTKKYVVWFILNSEYNNCKVYRKLWDSLAPEPLSPADNNLIYDCVRPYADYKIGEDIIYLKPCHINALIKYNLDTDEESIEYQRDLSAGPEYTNLKSEINITNKCENGFIGNFEVIHNKLIMETEKTYNGKIYDKAIILDNPHHYSGQVFYDCLLAQYIVKCPEKYSSHQKELYSVFGHGNLNTETSIHMITPEQLGASLAMDYLFIGCVEEDMWEEDSIYPDEEECSRINTVKKNRIMNKATALGVSDIVGKLLER